MSGALGERPVPTRATKDRIHDFAEQVATHLRFLPGDLLEPVVARLHGSIVFRSDLEIEGAPPSIVVAPDRRFTIHLPVTTSPRRNRFTIAHELGHLFLHFPMVQKATPGAGMVATRWVDEDDPVQRRAEWEANWFAAAFLMPASRFKERFSALGGDLLALSDEFDVSLQAAELRAKAICGQAVA